MKKPSVNDDSFYETVADELNKGTIIPGLRAKAFAEANGVETLAQALYLKYRVAQLVQQELDQRRTQAEAETQRKNQEWATEVAAQEARAKAEGLTSIHFILLGLLCLIFGLVIWNLL
ncbi:hypothetical protein [Pseudomonas chlororaphis]|uniref:hypothetical protein n=1 Tax=Pseudomonas chlororaphis TaxID=587753 RepID=UPI0013200961|nr:hypothetical protein [Pseudomonas chlororaphis]QHC91344.1 hypothetical protein PchlR47_24595 [Pseudomonas chlororaphis]